MLSAKLVQMHVHSRDAECCLGPALTAAGKVMGHVGGKMVVLCASLPSTGEARLKHRENPRVLGTDREHILLKPEDTWYQVMDGLGLIGAKKSTRIWHYRFGCSVGSCFCFAVGYCVSCGCRFVRALIMSISCEFAVLSFCFSISCAPWLR